MKSKGQPKKKQRKEESLILDRYHQILTENLLNTLYEDFCAWKGGKLPYHELTERIHKFHKANQGLWKQFNYTDRKLLLLSAKGALGLLKGQELEIWKELFDTPFPVENYDLEEDQKDSPTSPDDDDIPF